MIVKENKLENTPSGGALVGKRKGQTMIHNKGSMSGYLVGKTHANGGIKAINKSTGQPLEMQGGEVVITAPAVSDQTKRNFDGKMMTNREILSAINERGGGVSFAEAGMEIPTEMHFNGTSYNYGGKMLSDHDIAYELSQCGCEHKMKKGGGVKTKVVTYRDKYNRKYNYPKNTSHTLEEISKDTNVSMKGLQQIYNKGIGAYKTNPASVRPNVKSKEQWAMARVYSAVMGGKASKVDSNELKMNLGGGVDKDNLAKDSKRGNTPARDLNNYNDVLDLEADGAVGGDVGLYVDGGGVDKSNYRIINSNGRIKYAGTGMPSWFTLDKAKQLVDYSQAETIYEYDNNGERLWEVFVDGGAVNKKQKSFESEGSTEGKGKLYEFFTPQVVADKMLALAQHYGFKGGNVLEPATGSGRLIKNLKDTNITAFEISKDNFEILKREFPNAELYNFNFEKAFLKEPRFNTLLNRKGTETWLKGAPFDLVLANPPYGKFSGLYSSYFNFKGQVEHFFILQTLYLLKKGGLGVYLIPSSFLRNGVTYNEIKKQIFEIAEFVDAYRLPSNIFEKTQIGTDILILRKK
jgi:hypothetical protein